MLIFLESKIASNGSAERQGDCKNKDPFKKFVKESPVFSHDIGI